MKLIRSILALAFATAIAGSVAFSAADEQKAAKPEKAPCGCVVKKDGKVCGVDSDCCCTGEKAKGKSDAKKAACADGKCAEGKCADCKCEDGKCKDGKKCGEGKCGEGKCADGKCTEAKGADKAAKACCGGC